MSLEQHARSVVLVLLLACGGTPKPASTPPAAVQLALGELTIVDATASRALAIRADGTIHAGGEPVGVRVTTDGKIVKVDGGDVGFELRPDGTIRGPAGETLEVTLGADGTMRSGDRTMHLDDRGVLVGANPDAPQIRIQGATTPALERTALFVLIALTSPIHGPAK